MDGPITFTFQSSPFEGKKSGLSVIAPGERDTNLSDAMPIPLGLFSG